MTKLTGNLWRYERVDHGTFEKLKPKTFGQLIAEIIRPTHSGKRWTAPGSLPILHEVNDPEASRLIAANSTFWSPCSRPPISDQACLAVRLASVAGRVKNDSRAPWLPPVLSQAAYRELT